MLGQGHQAHSPKDVNNGDGTRTLYYFTGTVDTDGTAMHLHFRRCTRPGEKPPPTDDEEKKPRPAASDAPSLPKLATVTKVLLLADPGRVNMVTFTVMVDGEVIVESCGAKGHRMRPVKFGLTAKQYHTMIGTVRRRKIRERRLKQDPEAKQLDTDLSGTTLRTGDISKILAYMEKSNLMAERRWDDALSTRASNGRRRSALARQRVLAKWLTRVHDKVLQELEEAKAVDPATRGHTFNLLPTKAGFTISHIPISSMFFMSVLKNMRKERFKASRYDPSRRGGRCARRRGSSRGSRAASAAVSCTGCCVGRTRRACRLHQRRPSRARRRSRRHDRRQVAYNRGRPACHTAPARHNLYV